MLILDNYEELLPLAQQHSFCAVITVCSRNDWTDHTVKALTSYGLKPILSGPDPSRYKGRISGMAFRRTAGMEHAISYLCACGRKRMALYGAHEQSPSALLRNKLFLEVTAQLGCSASPADIFYNKSGMQDCFAAFLQSSGRYDAVIGNNDLASIHFLQQARTVGLAVPEQLFVVGFGGMRLSAMTIPTLTTVIQSHRLLGEQAVSIWALLNGTPSIDSMIVNIPWVFQVRESTANIQQPVLPPVNVLEIHNDATISDSTDAELAHIVAIENFLATCDALDLKILDCVLRGESYERISESLFVSLGTVNYRLKKFYTQLRIPGRAALEQLLLGVLNPDKLHAD